MIFSSRPKLKILPDGFVAKRGFRSNTVQWKDIREIRGVALEKVTYDENFLMIITATETVYVGELDKNFDAFGRILLDRFPNFPLDWKGRVEAAGYNSYIGLWRA